MAVSKGQLEKCQGPSMPCRRKRRSDWPAPRSGERNGQFFEAPLKIKNYLILSYTANIGRYIASSITATMPPTMTIMAGSSMDVSAFTVELTSSS